MKDPKKHPKQKLLVEGRDDQHVIWNLCEKFEVDETFDVVDCEGIDELQKDISSRLNTSGIQAVGIVVDADTDLNSRWCSIKNIISERGFTVPEILPSEGLILGNEGFVFGHLAGIRVGVWIMPNNQIRGMLEDFISYLVPEDELQGVRSILSSVETQKLAKYPENHRSKAVIHSWLAWQEDPGTPMGLAIKKKYLTTDAENCKLFIDWLKKLFTNIEEK